MVDVVDCHVGLLACLREVVAGDDAAMLVFDGDVDTALPVDEHEDLVLPYLVVWGSGGAHATEGQDVTGTWRTEQRWNPRVTAAAGTQRWCLEAAGLAQRAARSLVLPGGGRLREPPGYAPPTVRLDRDQKPPRYFLPMEWTALLP